VSPVTVMHLINSAWLATFLGMVGVGWYRRTFLEGSPRRWWTGAVLLSMAWLAFFLGYHWGVIALYWDAVTYYRRMHFFGLRRLGWIWLGVTLASLVGIGLILAWDRRAYPERPRGSEGPPPEGDGAPGGEPPKPRT
jgi:hypothetical protein